MVQARLLVERGSLRDRSEEWGEHGFVALPSPGDRLAVPREGETNHLTVICVHHELVPPGASGEASAFVVAKWTGKG